MTSEETVATQTPFPGLKRAPAADPQTSAPNPNAYLKTASPTTTAPSAPPPSSYLRTATTSIQTVGAPHSGAFLKPEDGYVTGAPQYFVGAYLPTLIAVLFALPWLLINRSIKSLEPFYQLSKTEGALAENSITADFSSYAAPFQSLFYGRWAVVCSDLLFFLSLIVTPLAPEAVSIHTIGDCNATSDGCIGQISVLMPAIRAIQGLLALAILLTLVLILLLRKRKINLFSDPRSVAGLAIIFSNIEVRRDISEMYGLANSDKSSNGALKGARYRLEYATGPYGFSTIALMRATGGPSFPTTYRAERYGYSALNPEQKVELVPTHKLSSSLVFVFLVCLATLIIVYRYTGGDNGFERFMDSQGFGVRFLFTLISVIIGLYWKGTFQGMIIPCSLRILLTTFRK